MKTRDGNPVASGAARLLELIGALRGQVRKSRLDAQAVANATASLVAISPEYEYDMARFPQLPVDRPWKNEGNPAPTSLAEALLWKMGKWKVYTQFRDYHANPEATSKETDVVFYGFAHHVRDSANPIYDQHALRALFAIDAGLNQDDREVCRSLLFKTPREEAGNRPAAQGRVEWKSILGGRNARKGYALYCSRIRELCSGRDAPTGDALDKLLMPLGQAIKDLTGAKEAFSW
jgi:hypothetical protein